MIPPESLVLVELLGIAFLACAALAVDRARSAEPHAVVALAVASLAAAVWLGVIG